VIGARFTGELDLRYIRSEGALTLRSSVFDMPCDLSYMRLGYLDLSGSHMVEMDASGVRIEGDIFLDELRVTGNNASGVVRLSAAHIRGHLEMHGADLTNTAGPALHADRLEVRGGAFLRDAFRAVGAGRLGAVRLASAQLHATLEMDDAELINTTGPALHADGLEVGGNVFMRDGFRATGTSELDTVRLLGAHIRGVLDMSGAHLVNTAGVALSADGLQVDGSISLCDGFRASGIGLSGTVRLPGARMHGDLNMHRALIEMKDEGLAIDLEDTSVGSTLHLSAIMVCAGVVTVAGRSDTTRYIGIDGLTYGALSGIGWRQWLHLIRHHSDTYAAQPYQQLAAVERACGHDGPARRILIAQQDDLRARGQIGHWPTRLIHWVWGKLGGYGYRTGRLITALLLAILTAGALGVLAGHTPIRDGRTVAWHTTRAETPNTPCSLTELVGLGIDRGLPLGATGLRDRCDLDTTSHRGQAITLAIWSIQALIWALATLAIAGYTGLIRKIT
jgi:hypothetical protein